MATKPSTQLTWVPGDEPSKIDEPTTDKKAEGWLPEEKPPFQWFNWFWNLTAKWVKYYEDKTDELQTQANNNASSIGTIGGTVTSHTSTLNSHTNALNQLNTDLDLVEGDLGAVIASNATKVAKSGDTMSGELDITISSQTVSVFQQILRSRSTGLISGGAVTVNADPAKVDIALGVGAILNQSNPASLQFTPVNFTAKTAVVLTSLASARLTYLGINSSGNTVQQTTPPTNTQRRSTIWLAVAYHPNNTSVTSIGPMPDVLIGQQNSFRDLYAAIGVINMQGNVISPNGANLKLDKTAGKLFALGIAFASTPQDPHVATISSGTALSFTYAKQDGGVGSSTDTIVPGSYDVAGTVTTIPGSNSRATNQRVYLNAEGSVSVLYGQQYYDSLANAVAGIANEVPVISDNARNNAVLIGVLSLVKNATNLSNVSQAVFTPVSKFGIPIASGSGSGGGLTNEPQSSTFSAVSGKRYLLDLTTAIPIAMPQGAPGASVSFFDALGKADKFNALIGTITPFTGDKFQGMLTDEPLQLDGKYQRIDAWWDTANSQWDWDTNTAIQVAPATDVARGTISREQDVQKTSNLSGATTSPVITVQQTRLGKMVNITISPSGAVIKNGAGGSLLLSGVLDADFRPSAAVYFEVYTLNGACLLTINTAGSIQVYSTATGSNFAAGATNIGWDVDLSLTFSIR